MRYPRTRALGAIVLAGSLLAGCDTASVGLPGHDTGGAAGEVIATAPTAFDSHLVGLAEIMRYRMVGVDGVMQETQAVVLTPAGEAPEGGWPLLVWGHGTTGVADACAPSRTDNLFGYLPLVNGFLSAGFALVAPDYEGMGNAGSDHPYLHLESSTQAMTLAAKAAVATYPQLSNRFAAVGHSQGAHAAIGLAKQADQTAPLDFVGAVAIAPASQLETSARQFIATVQDTDVDPGVRVEAGVRWLAYVSFLLYGLEVADPSFDVSQVYGENGAALEEAVQTACLADIFYGLRTTVPLLLDTQGDLETVLQSEYLEHPKVQAYLRETELGPLGSIDKPVLMLQGSVDPTVLPGLSRALRDRMLDEGVAVDYREYPGDHLSILQLSGPDAIGWLMRQFSR